MSGNGPVSFKDMTFPPARYGKVATYAPLPPPPSPRSISSQEKDKRITQGREFKKFVNSLRCPICNAQLEGPISFEGAVLECVSNPEEYLARYRFGFEPPIQCRSILYTTNFGYEFASRHLDGDLFLNQVFKMDLSLNVRFRQSEKKEMFSYEGPPLLIKGKLSEEELLDKLNLYSCFS